MQKRIRDLYLAMSEFDRGRPDLIQHFTKVHAYAALIAECEGMDAHTSEVLQAAALVHDIAIPLCDQRYGSHPGPLQEQEGPALVRSLLSGMDFTAEETERICTLVGEHYTLSPIDGIDLQILLEADFLVNCYSHGTSREGLEHTLSEVIATGTGKRLFAVMFGLDK